MATPVADRSSTRSRSVISISCNSPRSSLGGTSSCSSLEVSSLSSSGDLHRCSRPGSGSSPP
eukprot:10791469-Lingulodinium_polyedra.AAC.1